MIYRGIHPGVGISALRSPHPRSGEVRALDRREVSRISILLGFRFDLDSAVRRSSKGGWGGVLTAISGKFSVQNPPKDTRSVGPLRSVSESW